MIPLFLALLACGTDGTVDIADADGDGFDAPEDCDDGDATVGGSTYVCCNQ